MRVSVRLLEEKHACVDQVRLFTETFGDGEVEVTETLCNEHAGKFDFEWAAQNLLPKSLRADYEAKHAPLLADYEAKHASFRADYQAKRASLLADYDAKRASLLADYQAKRAPLWADYEGKRASLFGKIAEQTDVAA